jgi:AcrR family transcriptional regulator
VALLPEGAAGSGSRARILEAGLELFATRGYHGTSIRDIASTAGLQSASLYGHFSSKESILAELVLVGHEAHHRALTLALMECGSDPVEQLRALELMHLTPEAAAPAEALRDQSLNLLMTVVGRGMASGAFDVPEPDIILTAISTMGSSVSLWHPTRPDISRETLCRSFADLAVRMVERKT